MPHALLSPRIHMHYEDYGLSSILYKHDQRVRRTTKPKVDISLQNAIIPPAPRSGRYLLNPARAERQQRSVSSSGCSKVPPWETNSRRICAGCLFPMVADSNSPPSAQDCPSSITLNRPPSQLTNILVNFRASQIIPAIPARRTRLTLRMCQ